MSKPPKMTPGMNKLLQMQASGPHQDAIQMMLPQLLIVLVNRAGGEIEIPVAEIDGTGDFDLSMKLNPERKSFTFIVGRKR